MKYELHPACAAWPQMPDDEIEALAIDIKENGQKFPIILHDEKILDGRNRALACDRAGIDPAIQIYNGDDPIAFVISVNLHRRHLSTKERAEIAAKLANMPRGGKEYRSAKLHFDRISLEKAAKLMNVSRRSVAAAKERLKTPSKAVKQNRARAILREHGSAPIRQLEKEHGISLGSFQRAQVAEDARREAFEELGVSIDDLSLTAQQKFGILEKRLRADMEGEIARRVKEGVRVGLAAALEQRDTEDAEVIKQANVLLASRVGRKPFTAKEYTGVLLRALHPDTTTPELLLEAFKLVKDKQLLLREEGKITTRSSLAAALPKTAEEWAAAKAAKQAERRKKRSFDDPYDGDLQSHSIATR